MVEWVALEKRYARKGIGGSNPPTSASQDFASGQGKPRGGFAAARLGFEVVHSKSEKGGAGYE